MLNSFYRALTSKTIRVHGESVTSAITSNQSRDVRDAFAKGIYGRLFIHIVKVNYTFSSFGKILFNFLESEHSDIQEGNKWE